VKARFTAQALRLSTSPQLRSGIVTAFSGGNLLLGLLALYATINGLPGAAAWCLLGCVVLDGCDGQLARRWGVDSAFGAQLDVLADMTSFCVAAAVLAFYWFLPGIPLAVVAAASCLFVFSGAFRLARFHSGFSPETTQTYFQGMPTTAVATVLAVVYLTYPQLNSAWGVALVVLLAILMVSVFPYPRLSQMARYPRWIWLVSLVGLAVNLDWTLWLGALAYAASGPVIWWRRKFLGHQG
jgi:CDP-diacylglycerol--serine O-phosphatidyltransferase